MYIALCSASLVCSGGHFKSFQCQILFKFGSMYLSEKLNNQSHNEIRESIMYTPTASIPHSRRKEKNFSTLRTDRMAIASAILIYIHH